SSPWGPSLVVLLVLLAGLLTPSGLAGLPGQAASGAEHPPAALGRAAARPAATLCALLGDINCDGIVDLLDYGLWRQAFGATNCGNPADLNGDCFVDILDYGIWRQNFGHVAPTVTPTVAVTPTTTATPTVTATPTATPTPS